MGINTDSFRDTMNVEINGQAYSIKSFTIRDYVNQTVKIRLSQSKNMEEYLANMVALISERSNIPKDVLMALSHSQREALLMTMQGVDSAKTEQVDDDKEVEFASIASIMMSAYGCSLQEIMDMPIRLFWALVMEIPKRQNNTSLRLINAINTGMWGNEKYIDILLGGDSKDDSSNDKLDKRAMTMFKRGIR